MYISLSIYIYIERERDIYIYIIFMYIYVICICIYWLKKIYKKIIYIYLYIYIYVYIYIYYLFVHISTQYLSTRVLAQHDLTLLAPDSLAGLLPSQLAIMHFRTSSTFIYIYRWVYKFIFIYIYIYRLFNCSLLFICFQHKRSLSPAVDWSVVRATFKPFWSRVF